MQRISYANPQLECDLIMQGGITSGVVYPPAVLKLAPRYRFRNIGGTSAGAIAAAAAAAAELGRDRGGFEELANVPGELARNLSSLFQPVRPFRGVYSIFIACLGRRPAILKVLRVLGLLLLHFWIFVLAGLTPVALYVVLTAGSDRGWLEWSSMLAAAGLGVGLAVSARAAWLAVVELPRKDFGVCSGMGAADAKHPALTEWIADLLDRLAGLQQGRPLTFGDLQSRAIQLEMMTTNLSLRRPYSLPFATHDNPVHENRYAFAVAEWANLFPKRVMEYLLADGISTVVTGAEGFRYLPDMRNLPVIVAVRMSLSFPFLLAAIPLHRRDPMYIQPSEQAALRRCIFSDGGISSNFPIQFFDALLPNRPTFAVSLDEYSQLRHRSDAPDDRVSMPQGANSGALLPIVPVQSLPGFIVGIIDAARLWQDNLQKLLPGYRERVAHVALTDFEGGLNLNMDEPVVAGLAKLGDIAADRMLNFDLDEHRWRRFLVAYARLEESLEHMNEAYAGGFKEFLDRYPPHTESYVPDVNWLDAARDRLERVLNVTAPWAKDPLRKRREAKIPRPDTDLRITPRP